MVNASSTSSVEVWASVCPESVLDVCEAMHRSAGRVSVSGSRFSPDAQFALEGALHLDLSRLDRIVRLEPLARTVCVQAGARWSDLLQFLLPHDLVPRIMPAYANFSVGGSVASNRIGPYVGTGPVGEAVRSLVVVLADGSVRRFARDEDPDAFCACIGGFGGVGVIVEVELELADNVTMLRKHHVLDADGYPDFLRARVLTDPGAIVHRAELDPTTLETARCETWVEARAAATWPQRLQTWGGDDPLARMLDFAHADGVIGRATRRLIVDPLHAMRRSVHWRSFVASADLRAFDAQARGGPRHVFQAYAVPLDGYQPFLQALRAIADAYRLPLSKVSIFSQGACTSSHLPLIEGRGLGFHLALRPDAADRARDPNDADRDNAVWTRELVQAALDCGGGFDPAYRMHATREQFARAFPGRAALAHAKQRLDPRDRFGNGFWSRYLGPVPAPLPEQRSVDAAGGGPVAVAALDRGAAGRADGPQSGGSEFVEAMGREEVRDVLYRLLGTVAPAGCGPRLFRLLQAQCRRVADDELIYRALARALQKWRPGWHARLLGHRPDWLDTLQPRLVQFSRDALHGRPARSPEELDGVAELGTAGRHVTALRRELRLSGELLRIDGFGLLASRPLHGVSGARSLRALAARTLPARAVPVGESLCAGLPKVPEVLDLVVLHAGLSQVAPSALPGLLARVATALREGGVLVVLEHDADSAQSALEASVSIRLAALCEGLSWHDSVALRADLRPADEWVETLAAHGFDAAGGRERIARTPLGDVLMSFTSRRAPANAIVRE